MLPPALPHPSSRACLRPLLAQHPLGRFKLSGYLEAGEAPFERCWVDDAATPRGLILQHRGRYNVAAVDEAAMRRLLSALDWSGEVRFAAFPEEFLPLLERLAAVHAATSASLYAVDAEAFATAIAHPVRSLREEEAPLVAEAWEYGDDVAYCRQRIAVAPSAGVEVGGRLASFIITHADGSMGILHTSPALRRQGLGRSVASALSRELVLLGRSAYCFIVDGNAPSVRLFEGLGFRRQTGCFWLLAGRS